MSGETAFVPDVALPHQREGIAWLRQRGSGILADQPGLGKTLQTIASLDAPALVVCPAVMRAEWADEVQKWRSSLTSLVVSGARAMPSDDYIGRDVVVINYDILDKHEAALVEAHQKRPFRTLVFDEAHALKTLEAKRKGRELVYEGSRRAVSAARLCKLIPRKIFLSATPVLNRPVELWPLLHMLDGERWNDLTEFGKKFCAGFLERVPRRGSAPRMAWNFNGASNVEELHEALTRDHMIRRDKSVLSLPPKTRVTLPVWLPNDAAREYEFAKREFLEWVFQNGGAEKVARAKRAEKLAKMTALRGLAAKGKVPLAVDWLKRGMEQGEGPFVVMAHHAEVLSGLREGLEQAVPGIRIGCIVGGQDESSRKHDKEAFQAGELDLILCSIMAAGVGLTLTRSCRMLFLERTFRAMDLVQAEDRIHRLGQKRPVTITYLDARNTIDEKIASMLLRKTKTIAGVIEGEALDEQQAAQRVFGTMFGHDPGVEQLSFRPTAAAANPFTLYEDGSDFV